MYPIAIVGTDPNAAVARLACEKAGFSDIALIGDACRSLPATTLGANTTRILSALGLGEVLAGIAHVPDREQLRLAKSAYLVAELPLAGFYADRYGSALVNVEAADLDQILNANVEPHSDLDVPPSIDDLAQNYALVVVTNPNNLKNSINSEPTTPADAFTYFHSTAPLADTMTNCNISWLGDRQVAWQYSTSRMTHFIFASAADKALNPADWHHSLHDVVDRATVTTLSTSAGVREHWQEGNFVYLGQASYNATPFFREALACGFEDAWVLSRMLENYEEAMLEGLREYVKYRRPRAQKIILESNTRAKDCNQPQKSRRILRNIGSAVSTRFLPEIAMSKRDWFHGHDCIKGFR